MEVGSVGDKSGAGGTLKFQTSYNCENPALFGKTCILRKWRFQHFVSGYSYCCQIMAITKECYHSYLRQWGYRLIFMELDCLGWLAGGSKEFGPGDRLRSGGAPYGSVSVDDEARRHTYSSGHRSRAKNLPSLSVCRPDISVPLLANPKLRTTERPLCPHSSHMKLSLLSVLPCPQKHGSDQQSEERNTSVARRRPSQLWLWRTSFATTPL
jgi:hypothetical protein